MSIPDSESQDKATRREWGTGQHLAAGTENTSILGGIFKNWLFVGIILLTGTLCFGLGILSGREDKGGDDKLWIEQLPAEERSEADGGTAGASTTKESTSKPIVVPESQGAAAATALPSSGTYMASKDGTKYYLPTCSGAKRIKQENIVWFTTKTQAEAAGYSAASGCPGL